MGSLERQMADAKLKIESIQGRLSDFEQVGDSVNDIRKAHIKLATEMAEAVEQHSNVSDRLTSLEGAAVGYVNGSRAQDLDSVQVGLRDLNLAHAKLQDRFSSIQEILGKQAESFTKRLD